MKMNIVFEEVTPCSLAKVFVSEEHAASVFRVVSLWRAIEWWKRI
jgi:hypothetical protein